MGFGKGLLQNYPKCVFFILGNEFCERFSFYGMKAVLVLYLTRALGFDDNSATSIYHGFVMACYFTPIFGAMIADGWIGKYWTILSISVVYTIGNLVMAGTAFPPASRIGAFCGLALIAVGTGGIKPCVSAFGGDQFDASQVKQQITFFSIFYMSINLGSLISTLITPLLRSEVRCLGQSTCYPLAFGVPAALMVVAIVLFAVGTPWYKRTPPKGNVIGKMFRCIGRAIKNKCSRSQEKKDHWLEYADDLYDREFIADVRAVLRVLLMFIPLPVFWALFEQKGSRWTLQAGKMNGEMGNVRIQPDMMQAFNPVLIILLVPILENVVFPCINKLRIPNRPLQRLGFGMLLAAASFVIAGFVQIRIDNTAPQALKAGEAQFKFINAVPCTVQVELAKQGNIQQIKFPLSMAQKSKDIKRSGKENFKISFSLTATNCKWQNSSSQFTLEEQQIFSLIISFNKNVLTAYPVPQSFQTRTQKGQASFRVINALNEFITRATFQPLEGQGNASVSNLTSIRDDVNSSFSQYVQLGAGRYQIEIETASTGKQRYIEVKSSNGQVSSVVAYRDQENKIQTVSIEDLTKNNVNMLLQIPQYFIITLGECFFSITGLSFAYSQAPASMKSVLQAGWLLTSAFGNLIVIIVSSAIRIPSKMAEFFMFAGLMVATTIIFAIMSLMYTYVKQPGEDENEVTEKKEPGGPVVMANGSPLAGLDNKAYSGENQGLPGVFKKVDNTRL